MPRPKELHFFDPYWDGSFGDEDASLAPALFSRADGRSPASGRGYMYDVGRRAARAARRPPAGQPARSADRYRSHLRTDRVTNGLEGETDRALSSSTDPLCGSADFPRGLLVLQNAPLAATAG